MGCRLLSHSIHQNNLFQWDQGQTPRYITTNTSHEVTALLISHQGTWIAPFSLLFGQVLFDIFRKKNIQSLHRLRLNLESIPLTPWDRDAPCTGFTWVVNSVLTIFPKHQQSPVKVRTRTLLKGEGNKKSVKNEGFQSNEECDDKTVKQFPSVDVPVWMGKGDKLQN